MNFYIPTYNECLEIIDNNPDMYFYERKYLVDGYNISTFGYRYANYNNFILPIIDKPNINALEFKGITYIFDDNGKVFNHHLLLHKFWEIDQYEHCKYELYKNKKIKNVTTKEDGFLVSFLKLPNNKIISFTKKSLDDIVNIESNKYLDDKNYYNFINYCLSNNYQPIFEYIGRQLKVKYDNEDLVLLKIRNNLTGEYLDINNFNTDGISIVKNINKNIDEILEIGKNISNFEGWVVHFEDDTLLKVKTKWWYERIK